MAKANSYHSTEHTRKGAITSFGSRTDIGSVREQNEDSLVVAPPLFVVADGMGGHAAGEVASEIAVNTIAECAPEQADAEKLGEAVEIANREIINAALTGQGREGMGTTCTAAMLEDNHLVIAQVGDSRAYLLHKGELTQITRDHSLMADMIEAGQITPEEARYHPNRSVITRALGNDVDMLPDLYEIDVEDGDRLLLCSDGLTSMLQDKSIQEVMNRIADPQKCATALVTEAIAAGGLDNVTVIVANVEGAGAKRHHRLARKTRIMVGIILALLVVAIGLSAWGGYTYLHNTAYIGQSEDGYVEVYRGVPGDIFGFSYSELVETTDIPVEKLNPTAAERISKNMRVSSLDEALQLVESYREQLKEDAKAKSESPTAGNNAQEASSSAASTAPATSDAAPSAPDSNNASNASASPEKQSEGTA